MPMATHVSIEATCIIAIGKATNAPPMQVQGMYLNQSKGMTMPANTAPSMDHQRTTRGSRKASTQSATKTPNEMVRVCRSVFTARC